MLYAFQGDVLPTRECNDLGRIMLQQARRDGKSDAAGGSRHDIYLLYLQQMANANLFLNLPDQPDLEHLCQGQTEHLERNFPKGAS